MFAPAKLIDDIEVACILVGASRDLMSSAVHEESRLSISE